MGVTLISSLQIEKQRALYRRKRRRKQDTSEMHRRIDDICETTGTALTQTQVSVNLENQRVCVKANACIRQCVYRVRYDTKIFRYVGDVLHDTKWIVHQYSEATGSWTPLLEK